jgi:subtilisin family serine protease
MESRRMTRVRPIIIAAAVAASITTIGAAAAASAGHSASVTRPVTGPFKSGTVLVHYRDDASSAARSTLERGNGASRIGQLGHLGTDVLQVPAGREQATVGRLVASGLVDYAEVDGLAAANDVTPNDTYWTKEWGLSKVHAPHAWATTAGSSSITVAVVDTGLAVGLPEFTGRTVTGYNAFTGTSNTTDDNGHGTYAAGIVAAMGNNAAGVAGMCWNCRIMPVKVLDSSAQGDYATIARGITWAADHGARVINLSLGGTTSSATLDNAVSYAVNKGIVVVVAAGNNSCTCQTWPAASPGALSVGATDATDTLYSYSNRGSWVDVAAPGTNYSTGADGKYYSFGGTSSATPVVAGLAALLLSKDSTASVGSIAGVIESTSVPVSGGGVSYGRVDAGAAMDATSGSSTSTPSPSPSASTSPSPSPSPSAAPTTSASPSPAPTAPKPHGKKR